MNPAKAKRETAKKLTDLPNIGTSIAQDLELIGITSPEMLIGQDPYELYRSLCEKTAAKQDPCVLDVFLSIVDFMDGNPPKAWWEYTEKRKTILAERDTHNTAMFL